MKSPSTIASPATADTGRIRFGGGWRLPSSQADSTDLTATPDRPAAVFRPRGKRPQLRPTNRKSGSA